MKKYTNKTVEGRSLENGTLREVRTNNTKHISIHLKGTFSNSAIDGDEFGAIILDGGINLSLAKPKMITPPSGYKLVKIRTEDDETEDLKRRMDEFFDNLSKWDGISN